MLVGDTLVVRFSRRGILRDAGEPGGHLEAECRQITIPTRATCPPGQHMDDPIGALAHLQLGRAFALSRDTARAKTAYQDFFTLWKDANAEIPILKQAKTEYARLPTLSRFSASRY
jgi:hypothetical protein